MSIVTIWLVFPNPVTCYILFHMRVKLYTRVQAWSDAHVFFAFAHACDTRVTRVDCLSCG